MRWAQGVEAPSNGTPSTSLGHGAPDFELLRRADLPAAWQRPVDRRQLLEAAASYSCEPDQLEAEVLVELPDAPWSWAYFWWANAALDRLDEQQRSSFLRPMCVPMAEFADGNPEAQRRLLHSLARQGKPAPYFVRIFKLRDGHSSNAAAGAQ